MFDISSAEFFFISAGCDAFFSSNQWIRWNLAYFTFPVWPCSSARRFNASSTMKCPFNSSTRFSWGFGEHPACESQVTQLVCSDVLDHDAAQITLHYRGRGVLYCYVARGDAKLPRQQDAFPLQTEGKQTTCPISQQSDSYPGPGSTRTSPNIPQDEVSYRE